VGDATFSTKATARIREICARGKIVIVVSHGMQSIRDICNRCLWMENGRVVMDGKPGEVTKAYIDSVRAADEALLMEKFRKFIGARSLRKGWAVTRVTLFNGECGEERVLLEAGEPTRIRILAVAPIDVLDAMVRVRIVRLDGLLVFNEVFSTMACRLHDQSLGLEIEMTPLVLGTAIYRLDVSLESATNSLAEHSIIFEVVTPAPPTGGKPMLLYPVSASAMLVE
jgi:homopolymeric O-antigen transport system ATP-binding protein